MTQGAESTQDRVKRFQKLGETEKLSLIFTQQRKLDEYKERVQAFQCAHETGTCALCIDKDLMITQLQQQVKNLQNKAFGRSSERSNKERKPKKRKKSKKASKRVRLPSEQFPDARIQETIVQEAQPPMCSECNDSMTDSGMWETAEKIEYKPAELYIERTKRTRYHCKCCQVAPVTATLPARLAPGSSLGDSFIIQSCVSKFFDLIPTTRNAKILARANAAVSHKLLLKSQSIMAGVLISVYELIKQQILQNKLVHADETIHRQLQENGGNWRWYLWGFCTRVSVYYEIHDTRAGSVSINFLMEPNNILFLVSDAYSGYNRTIREINKIRENKTLPFLQSSLCNDHGRRYWFNAQAVELAKQALDLYDKIYAIEAEVQELLALPKCEEPKNSIHALKLRQTAEPLFIKIYNISCEILLESNEKSVEAKAAFYFINNKVGLTLYLEHIELPISNALAERSMRNAVILRKTSLGNHSLAGANEAAIHLSVMGSCKVNEVNPTQYLEFITAKHLANEPLLTPYEYKKLLEKEKPPNNTS